MTTPAIIILGITSLCFILFGVVWFLDKENPLHQVLRAFTFVFIITTLLLVPKGTLDANTVCEVVVNKSQELNSTTIYYTYTDFCYERSETTSLTFFKAYHWFYRLFVIWMFFYLIVYLFYYAKDISQTAKRIWTRRR